MQFNTLNFNKPGWTPPPDSTLLIRRREYVSALLLLLMCTLALAGICLALVFLVFNVKYRNHRFIKMSSPVSFYIFLLNLNVSFQISAFRI